MKSVIEFYEVSSSPVYICFLDASKAFDRINHWSLFKKLITRNIPTMYIRFLMFWYCTQEVIVRWNNFFSVPFTVSNGVRQGGVLSPLLFNLYVDDLSKNLNNCYIGCTVNDVLINHLIYADDLVLLAPSAHALQLLVNQCEIFADGHDIMYNTKKSVCMCIKPKKLNIDIPNNLLLNGKLLENVTSQKYLGVLVANNCKDDLDIKQQCKHLYSRGNVLIRNFKNCSEDVKCHLFRAYCSNIYCSFLWSKFNAETMRRLKVAYNRVFRILLGLQHRVSMSASFISRGMDPFPVLLRKSITSFRTRVLDTDNILLKAIVDSEFFTSCRIVKFWNSVIFTLN